MHIVILGNGISGVTCARYLRKRSKHEITVISDESDEFFSRTALMYVYMGPKGDRVNRFHPGPDPATLGDNPFGAI